MKELLAVPFSLILALATPAQNGPPPLDSTSFAITDSNGNPLTHPTTGEVLDAYSSYTPHPFLPDTYEGEIGIVGMGIVERVTVTCLEPGFYTYVNEAKGTFGFYDWNPNGYYETWSSYNGGTERRMTPEMPPGGAPPPA